MNDEKNINVNLSIKGREPRPRREPRPKQKAERPSKRLILFLLISWAFLCAATVIGSILLYRDTQQKKEKAISASYSSGYTSGYDSGRSDGYNTGNRVGEQAAIRKLSSIQIGKGSTAAEVLATLGRPDKVGKYPTGRLDYGSRLTFPPLLEHTYWVYGNMGFFFDGNDEMAQVVEVKGDLGAYLSSRFKK